MHGVQLHALVALHVPVVRALVGSGAAAAAIAQFVIDDVALVIQANVVQPLFYALCIVDRMAQALVSPACLAGVRTLTARTGAARTGRFRRRISLFVHHGSRIRFDAQAVCARHG
jgi:hypothetical protein